MAPKVALVTGTNSGIGLEVAVQLCQAGFTTYATVRTLAKAGNLRAAAEAAGVTPLLRVIEMDVTSDASVEEAVKGLLAETEGALDVAVANAGYADMSPPEAATPDRVMANLDVNLCGVVRLCNAVLPTMRAAGAGRVVVTSSTAGLLGFPMAPIYVSTKFAVEGYIESMAASYAPIGIHFTQVELGPVVAPFMNNTTAADGGIPAELANVAKGFDGRQDGVGAAANDDCARQERVRWGSTVTCVAG